MTIKFTQLAVVTFAAMLITAATSQAQDEKSVAASSLDAAKQLSAASGRPIFAIAGRST